MVRIPCGWSYSPLLQRKTTGGAVRTRQIKAWKGDCDAGAGSSFADVENASDSAGDFTATDFTWHSLGSLSIDKLGAAEAGLTPGIRRLVAYAYYDVGTGTGRGYLNRLTSGEISVEVKPGSNFLTVYLTEAF